MEVRWTVRVSHINHHINKECFIINTNSYVTLTNLGDTDTVESVEDNLKQELRLHKN
jgi:hypothetical protein